jgi:hypothetical protein
MARVRDYKAEYDRRIARAIAQGKTRQAARGHKPQEHILRREREIEEFRLTSAQIKSIRQWGRRYNNIERDIDDVIDFARTNGYKAFTQYRETWNAARRLYKKQMKNGTYMSKGIPYLQMLTEQAGVEEMPWLYYH